ncbi:MAG: hypothetical protein Fues2KO_17030 [Fuerstiella sp.]
MSKFRDGNQNRDIFLGLCYLSEGIQRSRAEDCQVEETSKGSEAATASDCCTQPSGCVEVLLAIEGFSESDSMLLSRT